MGAVTEFRAAAATLLDRYRWFKEAGLSFGGKRDLYQALGYDRILTNKQYRDRYYRGGVAKRIVEALPKACWRGGVELVENEDAKTKTAFETAWYELETRLKILARLQRADILCGLSTYAVVLIGAKDGKLNEELPKGNGPDDLIFLQAFSGGGGPGPNQRSSMNLDADCMIQTYDTNIESERFGLPETYQLKRTALESPMLQVPVHWTRIIHLAENCLDDDVFGQPTLESVWNLLDDLDKVTGGGAEAFWLRANQGLHLNLDKDAKLDAASETKLKDEVDEYAHQQSRVLKTRGMEVATLGSDVANFSNPADAILTQIAGTKSIPKRVLTGSEMGELASSQDRDNWKDQINGRQTGYVGPYIITPLVDRLIEFGYLPKPSKYVVRWPHIQTLTEQEKADGAQKWAQVNQTAGLTVFSSEEIRDKWYSMEPAKDSDQDAFRADLALKMASVNKTQGVTVFTSEEIRKTCYGWAALAPEEEVPIGAPERISVDQAPPQPGQKPKSVAAPAKPVAAEAHEEMLRVLQDAIETNNVDVIDEILGVRHLGGTGSGNFGHAGRPGEVGGSGDGGGDHAFGAVNSNGSDTFSRHTDASGTFSARRKALHDAVVDKALATGVKSDHPTTVILGGGPASGKSTVVKQLDSLPPNAVHIDVDEVRTKLPEYGALVAAGDKTAASQTHEEASIIAKRIGREAADRGFNVTLDGTGDSSIDNLTGKVALYRARGQSVEGHYVTVDTQTAVERANARGEKSGRFVPESFIRESHRDVSRVFPQAVERGLFDKFSLWDNNGSKPTLIASGQKKDITIHDPAAYQRFLAKGHE